MSRTRWVKEVLKRRTCSPLLYGSHSLSATFFDSDFDRSSERQQVCETRSASCTVGTCLLQHRCFSILCTAPCCTTPSVSTVQSAWTLTSLGSSRSQKSQKRITITIRTMVCVVTVIVVVSIAAHTSRTQSSLLELSASCPLHTALHLQGPIVQLFHTQLTC